MNRIIKQRQGEEAYDGNNKERGGKIVNVKGMERSFYFI